MTEPKRINTILLDLDGVLWRGTEPILDIQALFAEAAKLGCRVCCLTNNSTKSVADYQELLAGFGVKLAEEQIITSAEGTADFLAETYPRGSSVYLVGEEGLEKAVRSREFRIPDPTGKDSVAAVVVGLDRDLTYDKLKAAVGHIQQGAAFIGTNPDLTIPTSNGPAPGAGAILAAIERSSGVKPKVIGKPAPSLFQLALARAKSTASEAIMVGDRLETDILGAQRVGIHTCLVLSGATGRDAVSRWQPSPDRILEDASALLEELRAHDGFLI